MNTIKTIEQMVEAMEKFRYHLANNYEINAAIQAGRALLEELKQSRSDAGQEPVAWLNPYGGVLQRLYTGLEKANYTIPLYTHPPQSEARGLSQPAQHWHDLYKAKCQELHDERARLGAQIEALENEPAQPKAELSNLERHEQNVRNFLGEPKAEQINSTTLMSSTSQNGAQPKAEQCTWTQSEDPHMPDTWEADCGAMWTFTEGGPKDNDMKFCPNCGKQTIEAAHGIK